MDMEKQLQDRNIQQTTNTLQIRSINLPFYDFKYYTQLNLLIGVDQKSNHVKIFTINENSIEQNDKMSEKIMRVINNQLSNILFLENIIIVKYQNSILKININNFYQFEIIKDPYLITYDIYDKYAQVNQKYFMINRFNDLRLKIYQLKNFKISHTVTDKNKIQSIQYQNYLVQALTLEHLYYYNINMKKQIRKYKQCNQNEPIFNSNYIFFPLIFKDNQIHINIHDICSMKIIGTIETMQTQKCSFKSFMFIKDFKIIAILYSQKLDLYDFESLQLISSEDTIRDHNWWRLPVMKYDQKNSLIVFL